MRQPLATAGEAASSESFSTIVPAKFRNSQRPIRNVSPRSADASTLAPGDETLLREIAHEIKQPLFAISNYALACLKTLALENDDSAHKAERCAREIMRQAQRAADIVGRFAQLAGQASPRRETVDLLQVVDESIEMIADEARRRRICVERRTFSSSPDVRIDRIEIQQVFVNLLLNAFEAMRETPLSERRLEIVVSDHGDFVEAAVIDRGEGVSAELFDKLFTPLHSTKPGGMGIGLAICRRIVEAHGGRIWGVNNVDQGATFYFVLPKVDRRAVNEFNDRYRRPHAR